MNLIELHALSRDEKIEWAREATLDDSIAYSKFMLESVVADTSKTHEVKAIVGMYSGGNDSSTFMHVLKESLTHAAHMNTGIGIRETREFVRSVCSQYGLPLLEVQPKEGRAYEDLVRTWGFPGPSAHGFMYRYLKERGFGVVRKNFVTKPRHERVVFVSGVRVFESDRRMRNTEERRRDGSIQWCSAVMYWTNDHMREYRERFDVPRNPVSDHMHMSGECLCGSYAKPGEIHEIEFFYPEAAAEIHRLESVARSAKKHCLWGTPPPKKPSGAVGPTWICFCGAGHAEPDCPDGTWWSETSGQSLPPAGEFCAKCEMVQ